MDTFLVVYTAKADGVDQAAVKKAALEQYEGYYVRLIEEKDEEFEVHLAKLADRVSSRKREAAPPPFEKKDDAADDPEEDAESPEEEAAEDDGEKPDDDADSKDKGDKPKGDKGKDPAKEVERIINDLTGLFTELGGQVSDLKALHDEKDQKLKDITDVAAPDGAAKMDEVPPMADVPDAAEVGPTPGGPPTGAPPIPGKPPVPSGKSPIGPRGLPTSFTRTQIVDHPIKDDDGEYSVADVEAAVKADERFANYIVEEVKRDSENNVFKAKLVLV